jgi:cytosine/adenosine deaminase-related metal-dependent hydrolase
MNGGSEFKKVLEGVKILYGDEFILLERGYIAFEGEEIREVGVGSYQGEADLKLNGRGLLAIPGLINAHVHLGDSAFKDLSLGLTLSEAVSFPKGLKHVLLERTPKETLIHHSKRTVENMVSSGITCFADFREGGVEGVFTLREALKNLKVEALILGRPTLKSNLAEEVNMLQAVADGLGLSDTKLFSDDELKLLNKFFKGSKLIAVHAAEAPRSLSEPSEVERAVKLLKANLLIHMLYVYDWELKLAAESKAGIVVCPRSNASFGLGIPDVKRMFDVGLKVGLGTDNVMVCQPDMFREMEFTFKALRLLYRDPSYPRPETVFKMATLGGAEALGLASKMGSISEGKLANLALIDLEASNVSPVHKVLASLVHRVQADNVMAVFIRGKPVFSKVKLED